MCFQHCMYLEWLENLLWRSGDLLLENLLLLVTKQNHMFNISLWAD